MDNNDPRLVASQRNERDIKGLGFLANEPDHAGNGQYFVGRRSSYPNPSKLFTQLPIQRRRTRFWVIYGDYKPPGVQGSDL
ncbi:hypothetical protein PM082_004107 [Marasmius tenuissimus]|nr:hypothetical protein PM082_004107 [Marasmius tenuissimus]